jgi:arginase
VPVIGAALDLGAGRRRGVDMGPSAIRYAGLAERTATRGREVIDLVEADWLKPFAEPSACVGHLTGA